MVWGKLTNTDVKHLLILCCLLSLDLPLQNWYKDSSLIQMKMNKCYNAGNVVIGSMAGRQLQAQPICDAFYPTHPNWPAQCIVHYSAFFTTVHFPPRCILHCINACVLPHPPKLQYTLHFTLQCAKDKKQRSGHLVNAMLCSVYIECWLVYCCVVQ